MRQKLFNFAATHFLRVALAVKQNVPPPPCDVGLLGSIGIMLGPQGVAQAIEQFGSFGSLRRSCDASEHRINCSPIPRSWYGERRSERVYSIRARACQVAY
jgi:xanthosine utilization system XapX-like protein